MFRKLVDRIFIRKFFNEFLGMSDINTIAEFIISKSINAKNLRIKEVNAYYESCSASQRIAIDNFLRILIAFLLNKLGLKIDYEDVIIKLIRGRETNE